MTKITKVVLDHSFSLIVCDLLQLDLGIKNFDNKIEAVKLFKIIFIFRKLFVTSVDNNSLF